MKIASILPYKENYTLKGAGAVALWISDFIRDSQYKKDTYIIGSTKNKNYLTKNYINIKIPAMKLSSKSNYYTEKLIKYCFDYKPSVIEIHNRPSYLLKISKF